MKELILQIRELKLQDEIKIKKVSLTEELSLKQLDPANKKDIWLIEHLDPNDFWTKSVDLETTFLDADYTSDCIYNKSYSIRHHDDPIGYLEISKLYEAGFVYLCYSILERERRKGYARTTLAAISDILLEEMNAVRTIILEENQIAQSLANQLGYVPLYEHSTFSIYQKEKVKNKHC